MSETLAALIRAVIANPADRTVRLVYADALEETGEPAHLDRAEFIRGQIATESAAKDPKRHPVLKDRCAELFEAGWQAWLSPVAEAAGLPVPLVPGKRIRDRIARAVKSQRRRRPYGPYTVTLPDTTVRIPEHGLSFRFAGGFPEEVRFDRFVVPANGPELLHRWSDLIPLVHLHMADSLSVTEWESVDGSHLSRLNNLTLETLLEGVAPRIAASPALANLQRLSVGGADDYRPIVAAPIWERLRFLRLGGRITPNRLSDVAAACTLQHLEEFELVLGNPGWLIEHMMRAASGGVQSLIRALAESVTMARDLSRFREYGPALEELAAARWIKQLRVLRLTSGPATGPLGHVFQHFDSPNPEQALPAVAVLALADAVHSDKLERLVLPAALTSLSLREELMRRLGATVEFR